MTTSKYAINDRIQRKMSTKRRVPPGEMINEERIDHPKILMKYKMRYGLMISIHEKGGMKDKSIKAILAAWWLLPRTLCA